jgi:excisionase family DNA binding protein
MAEKYRDWPAKQDAARELGLSLRSIERLITEKKIRVTHRRVPGRKALTCCHPEDIAKLKASIVPATPVPAPAQQSNGAVPALKQTAQLPQPVQQLMAAFLSTLPYPPRKLTLSMREAVEYSGLTPKTLKELIADGKIKSWDTWQGLRISRASLEQALS